MYSVSTRLKVLAQLGIIPAEAWDFIIPHGPKLSQVAKEYLYAQIVRDIAKQAPNAKVAKQLMDAGREMTNFAAKNLVNGWEEGDDLCPPLLGPIPFPFPIRNQFENPAEAPQQQDSLRTLISGLRFIAKNTTVKGIAAQLEGAAKELDESSNVTQLRNVA